MKNALIAAVVAAVVATASGTAATILVTTKNIKNGTIQTVDISAKAKRALKGNRGPRGSAGIPGPAGPQGIQGPPGIQRLKLVVSPTVAIAPGAQVTAEAVCPAGEIAVSGGFGLIGPDAGVFQSLGIGSGWVVKAENAGDGSPAQVAAYAYCSPGVAFVP
jgi:hypothetical protein